MSGQRRSGLQAVLLILVVLVASATLALNAVHASHYSKHLSNRNTKPYYYGTKTTAASTTKALTPVATTKCKGANCKRDTQALDVPTATGPSPVIAARPTPAPVPPVGNGSNADGAPDLEDGLMRPRATKTKAKTPAKTTAKTPANQGGSGGGAYYLDKTGRIYIILTSVWAGVILVWAVAHLIVNWDSYISDLLALIVFVLWGAPILILIGTKVIKKWKGRKPHHLIIYIIGYSLAWLLWGLLIALLVFTIIRARRGH